MSARESTDRRRRRTPPAVRAATAGPRSVWAPALLLAAVLVVGLFLASRAEAYVYWANRADGTIGRAKANGTRVDQSFISGGDLGLTCGVAVDDAHVYWANYATIGRANLDGTGVDQSFITGVNFACGVAVDEGHVYWAHNPNPGPSAIGRANLDGTGIDQTFIAGVNFPCGVAVDDTHIYWADSHGSTIGRANLDGAGVDPGFIPSGTFPCGVAVDDDHVYWANGTGDVGEATIGRANLDGSDVDQEFITGATFPCGVAVDGEHVYWGNQRSVGRANLDGSHANAVFIPGGSEPCGVTADPLPFTFGELNRDKRRGTAKLTVGVPGPGDLELAKTKKVKEAKGHAQAEGQVELPVKPRGGAKRKLNEDGKAKVKAKVTFAPEGGEPGTRSKPIKLRKRG
jgi:virginiamycin B lyase